MAVNDLTSNNAVSVLLTTRRYIVLPLEIRSRQSVLSQEVVDTGDTFGVGQY